MKFKKSQIFLVLFFSLYFLFNQRVAAVLPESVSCKDSENFHLFGEKLLFSRVSELPSADRSIELSVKNLRFFKLNNKKMPLPDYYSSSQNVLLPAVGLILAAKKTTSLLLKTPREDDSVVITFNFDQKGTMTYVVYRTADRFSISPWVLSAVVGSIVCAKKKSISSLAVAGFTGTALIIGCWLVSKRRNGASLRGGPFVEMLDRELLFDRVALTPAQKVMSPHCRDVFLPAVQAVFAQEIVAAYEMAGFRYGTDQQDRIDFKQQGDWLGFAVYDGHAGSYVAEYLVGCGAFLQRLVSGVAIKGGVEKAFVDNLYSQVDTEILTNDSIAHSGSTAVICLINKKTNDVFFINLGDSRAVGLNSSGAVVAETVDHVPRCKTLDEVDRLGYVQCSCVVGERLNCELARIINSRGGLLGSTVKIWFALLVVAKVSQFRELLGIDL